MSNLITSSLDIRDAKTTSGVSAQSFSGVLKTLMFGLPAGGAAGTADDVDVFTDAAFAAAGAENTAPEYLFITRIRVTTVIAVGGATVQLRNQPGGAGDALSSAISMAAPVDAEGAAADNSVVSAGRKLYARRSDRSATGSVLVEYMVVDAAFSV